MNQNTLNDPNDCDAIRELIPDFAFGLADARESRLVEEGLVHCQDAVTQLAEFRQLQDDMRAGVPQVEPPPQLGARLMAAIAAPVVTPKPRRIPMSIGWLAAAVALIALVLTNAYWLTRADDLARREAAYELAENGGNDSQNGAFILTSTSALRWVRLPDAQQDGKAAAFLMWNAESQIGLLYVAGFPSLQEGKTYQLWLTRGDERASAGTFVVDDTGKSALLFHSSEPIDKYTWARITAEPENGSVQPTGNPVVVGQL